MLGKHSFRLMSTVLALCVLLGVAVDSIRRSRRACFLSMLFLLLLCSPFALADTIQIPENVSIIESEAFYGDSGLDQVILPDGIQRIESKAFRESGLSEIYLPDSLTFIAADAFDDDIVVNANPRTYAYEWAIDNGYIAAPKADGQLSYPRIIMDHDTFNAGDDVSFTLDWDSHAKCNIYDLYVDGNLLRHYALSLWTNYYTLHGYDLPPGDYILVVTSSAPNYKSNTATKHFTIVGTKPAAPYAWSDKYEVVEGEAITITVQTSGARYVASREWCFGSEGDDVQVVLPRGSETMSFTFYGRPSKQTFQFSLCIDGRWSEFSEGIIVYPKYGNESHDGILDPPAVSISETFQYGRDITFSITRDPDAENYRYTLLGNKHHWAGDMDSQSSILFYGCDFQSGEYVLTVTAMSRGFESVSTEKHFVIENSQQERPPAPSVTYTYTNNGREEVITFTIDTTGAERVLSREHLGSGYSYRVYDVTSDTQIVTYTYYPDSYSSSNTEYYEFLVCIDGFWSASTNLIISNNNSE